MILDYHSRTNIRSVGSAPCRDDHAPTSAYLTLSNPLPPWLTDYYGHYLIAPTRSSVLRGFLEFTIAPRLHHRHPSVAVLDRSTPSCHFADHTLLSKARTSLYAANNRIKRIVEHVKHAHNPASSVVIHICINDGSASSPRAAISAPPSIYLPNGRSGPPEPVYERVLITSTIRDDIEDSSDDKRNESEPPTKSRYRGYNLGTEATGARTRRALWVCVLCEIIDMYVIPKYCSMSLRTILGDLSFPI